VGEVTFSLPLRMVTMTLLGKARLAKLQSDGKATDYHVGGEGGYYVL
jgi:hypothetical protein